MLFQEGMLRNWRDCDLLSYLAFLELDTPVCLCDDLYIFDRSHRQNMTRSAQILH
jgi:hypothetical protein